MTRRNAIAIVTVIGVMTGLFHLRQAAWAPTMAAMECKLKKPGGTSHDVEPETPPELTMGAQIIPAEVSASGFGGADSFDSKGSGCGLLCGHTGSMGGPLFTQEGGFLATYLAQSSSIWPIQTPEDPSSPVAGFVEDPVVVDTGEFVLHQRDIKWPICGTFVAAERLYRHQTDNQGGITSDFGRHFNTNLRTFVEEDTNDTPPTPVVHLGNGEPLRFPLVGAVYESPAGWERFTLTKVGGTQYVLTEKHGTTYTFQNGVDPAQLVSRADRYNVGEWYFYDASGCCSSIVRNVNGVAPLNDIFIERNVDHTISLIYDTDGNSIQYTYDANSNLIKVEDACGSCSTLPTVEYSYDANNRMVGIKDANGTTIRTIVYDGSNRLSYYEDAAQDRYTFEYDSTNLVIDPTGASTEYTYGLDGNLSSKKYKMGAGDEDDILYTYLYDASGRATNMTAPNGAIVELRYDSQGNLSSKWASADGQTITLFSAEYEASYNRPVLEVNAQGQSTTYAYDSSGNGTLRVEANGTSKTFGYNAYGLVASKIVAGVETRYAYSSGGFVDEEIVDYGGLGLTTSYTVDSMGLELATVSAVGNTTSTTRDGAGNVLTETSAEGIVKAYDYDANGREVSQKIMDGETVQYAWVNTYDDDGQVISTTSPDGEITSYTYDDNGRRSTETQPNGRKTEWVYDQLGRVIELKKGDTNGTATVKEMTYDKMGNVVSTEDAEGRVTEQMYDGFGRGTTVVDATGAYTVYEYDGVLLTAVKRFDSSDQIVTHSKTEYDEMGRITLERQLATPGGSESTNDAVSEREYDAFGQVIRRIVWVDASNANSTNYAYDAAGRMTLETDPDSSTTAYAYDDDGNLTLLTNGENHQTSYEYDDDGQQTLSTTPDGSYTITVFDDRGAKTEASQYSSGDTLLARTRYEYDAGGYQTLQRRMADPTTESDTNDHVVRSYYDEAGVLTKERSASGYDTTYTYDSQGRHSLATLPDGSYTAYSYDDSGTLTSQVQYEIVGASTLSYRHDYTLDVLGRRVATINQGPDGTFDTGDDLTTEYVYDGAGRQVSTIDEADRVTVTEYNALGRATKVTEDTTGIARVAEFTYDRAGQLITLSAYTDSPSTGQQDTAYTYNGRGLPTVVTYEETGDVSMSYDNVGKMIQRIDEAGVTVDYEYDAMNRVSRRLENGSTDDVEKYVYDALGRLVTAEKGSTSNSDSVSRSVLAYDNLSRVTSENQAIAEGTAKVVEYTYDKAGNRITLQQDAGQNTVSYAYDSRDRCVDIDQYDAVDSEWVQLAEYTWLGNALNKRETTCDYPGNTKPKFKTEFGRDGIMRVISVDNVHLTEDMAVAARCQLGSWDYSYDASSNVVSTLSAASSMDKLRDERIYTYDTLNRLISTEVKDIQDWSSWTGCEKTTSYTYDDLGNRGSHDHREEGAIAYAHDKANRMTTLAGLSQGYDLAGNQTVGYSVDRGTSYVYKYDHSNRLEGIYDGATGTTLKASFTYDALGRRIEFTDALKGETVRYYYDGVNEILETNAAGTKLRAYVHGISYVDERLMMMDFTSGNLPGSERPYYFVIDRMYNVRGLVDRAGALIERYVYDPYGRPLIRECAGRGDLRGPDSALESSDDSLVGDAIAGTIWDARADMDDDGDFDAADQTAYDAKEQNWYPAAKVSPTVAEAFSDVGNPFMFQGRPHFALDTQSDATEATLMLNDHRARFSDPIIGRWLTRDPLEYNRALLAPGAARGQPPLMPRRNPRPLGSRDARGYGWAVAMFQAMESRPMSEMDPSGLITTYPRMNPCEICACHWYPLCCGVVADQTAGTGFVMIDEFGPTVSEKDDHVFNAIQHCMWNCRIAANPLCSCAEAKEFTDCHEKWPTGNWDSPRGKMDRGNNRAGLSAGGCTGPEMDQDGGYGPTVWEGETYEACRDRCIEKAENCQLKWIETTGCALAEGDWADWCRETLVNCPGSRM